MNVADFHAASDIGGGRVFSTIVINLDRDSDRLAFISEQLQRQGMAFERFSAVLGAALPAEMRNYFAPREDGTGFLSPGELGCYASHLGVYEAIADGRIASPALVIEDDVQLPENLRDLIEEIIVAAPAGWDFIRLATPAKRAYFTLTGLRAPYSLVRYSMSSGSNAGMLVSAEGARKFLNRSIPRSAPIDQDNRQVWRFDLNVLGVVPSPIGAVGLNSSSINDLTTARPREDKVRQTELSRMRKLGRRHAWNIEKFGVLGWAASETLSGVVALVSKRARPRFLARTGVWLQSIARSNA